MPEKNVGDSRRNEPPERQVGDAGLLFRDDPASRAASPGPQPQPAAEAAGEFALVDVPEPASDRAEPAFPSPSRAGGPQPPVAGAAAREQKGAAAQKEMRLDPEELVPEPWSRWGEWGMNLIVVGAWLTVLLLLVYFLFVQDSIGPAFLLLLVGGLVAVVLSYPMLITLERPVRITPEQAARDYYAALSHHVPHFRRMWLLLSAAGRISAAFGSFEGFKGYWKDQLAGLRRGHAGPFTPLVFEVADFKSEKSAGKARIDATYNVNVSVRGQRASGAIHTIPVATALVRGPDNMWYLECGTLPRNAPAAKAHVR